MIKHFFLKHKTIILLLVLALLLRLPWLYTTVHKDEGQFGYVAWRWLEGKDLYTYIKDNKPPLLYALYSVPVSLFGNSIIPVRILNDILFLLSIIFFFKLLKNSFSKKVSLYSSLFYTIFMSIPAFDGYFALSEPLLTPFLILSAYFFERYISMRDYRFLFMSSALASVSALIKQQAVFVFPFLISGLFIYKERFEVKKIIFITSLPAAVMFAVLLFYRDALLLFLKMNWYWITESIFGFSAGYRPYQYNLVILIEGSVLFLFAVVGLTRFFMSEKDKKGLFFFSWLCFASVAAFMPPMYGRFLIFIVPPAAVFAGIGVDYLISLNRRLFVLLTLPLVTAACVLVISQFPDSNLDKVHLEYRWSSLESYEQQIGLAKFIKNATDPADEMFIFEWEPSIYWLSERIPPKSLGLSYKPQFANQSYLKNVLSGILMNQTDLKLVIFLYNYTFIDEYFSFLPNATVVHGVNVYELKADDS